MGNWFHGMVDAEHNIGKELTAIEKRIFQLGVEWGRRDGIQSATLQRPWVGLTDVEINTLIEERHFDRNYKRHSSDEVCLDWYRLGASNAEEKLKEKNHG